MTDTDANANVNASVDQPIDEAPQYLTIETFRAELNRAVTARFKDFERKNVKSDPVLADKEMSAAESKDPQIQMLYRQVKELQQDKEISTKKMQTSELHNSLTNELKGRVNDDWIDLAVKELASRADFSGGNAYIKFNDETLSVSDGVKSWLSEPSNKRFLPAGQVVKKQSQITNNSVNSVNHETDRAQAKADALNLFLSPKY